LAYRKSPPNPRGRKSKYVHLLRAMRAGDVIYLSGPSDTSIVATVYRDAGRCETARFVAVNPDPAMAHAVIRVTMITPMGDNHGLSQD
jgi:hypothetical protein